MKIHGKVFTTSSHSGGTYCVGISVEKDKVTVINTKEKKTTIEFTRDEWLAFTKGVKNGEFDL